MRLFDSHNHVHLGPRGVSALLESIPTPLPLAENASPSSSGDAPSFAFAGAAVMSTHPRDYPAVDAAVAALRENSFGRCPGISSSGSDDGEWLAELRQRLIDTPDAIVGEIGLDGARWREVEAAGGNSEHESIWDRERVLSCPMHLQQRAFEEQLLLAAELGRPASIHVVRAWGELFDSLSAVRERMLQKHVTRDQQNGEALNDRRLSKQEKKQRKRRKLLPPKLYFHAFSGKAGVIPSLLAACEMGNVPREDVYFGFPPEQDRHDEYLRDLKEAERKNGRRGAAKIMSEMEEKSTMSTDFQAVVYKHLDELLFGLVVRVGKEGTPMHNRNLQQLNLPLLSNEYDKEDLMLATAFALGDPVIVHKVTKAFEKQKLGIGLKKFSTKSIKQIIGVLETVEDPDISHKDLASFIYVGAYRSDFRERKPKLLMLNDEIGYSKKIWRWGEEFNVHVIHDGMLNEKRPDYARQKMKFTYHKSVPAEPGGVILSNFYCPFEASIALDRETGTLSSSFDDICVIGPKRTHNMREPNVDAIASTFAGKIAAGIARAAVLRLRVLLSLKRRDDGISHEHICVRSGCSSDLLRSLREQDMHLIATHEDKISATLHATLKHNAPPPGKKALKKGESPDAQLDREISQFVTSYIKLVHLAYCEVPLLGGSPPSSFVPEYNVHGAALRSKDCLWEAKPLLTRARTRLLQKEERERLVLSRDLVAPGKVASFLFVLSSWAFASWLCTVTAKKVLDSVFPLHSFVVLFAASQVFTTFLLHSLLGIFKTKVFGLSDDSSWMVTVAYCTEFIQRRLAAKRGKPTPYDQEMLRLKMVCKTQYKEWKLRIAKKEFRAALKRKKITARESMMLLTDFAANYYETADEEVVKGVIPAPLSEAEEFLKMKVEEQSPYDEIELSPDDTIKNYLQSDNEKSGRLLSLEALSELSAKVEECIHFAEGDRVMVELKEEDLNGLDSGSSPIPTCTDLSTEVRGGTQTGSVVFCTATLCFVHFDGGSTMIPVPFHRCSRLDENLVPNEDSASKSGDDLGDEFVEGSDDDEIDNEGDSVDAEERVPIPAPQAQKRARTVEEALVDGGWEFQRRKKHIQYSRRVKLPDGGSRKQNVTMSATPSDWRAERNALAVLRRLDEVGVVEVESEDAPSIMCTVCHDVKQPSDFSKAQLRKGAKKCRDCVSKL